jgi:hypothetical protein
MTVGIKAQVEAVQQIRAVRGCLTIGRDAAHPLSRSRTGEIAELKSVSPDVTIEAAIATKAR